LLTFLFPFENLIVLGKDKLFWFEGQRFHKILGIFLLTNIQIFVIIANQVFLGGVLILNKSVFPLCILLLIAPTAFAQTNQTRLVSPVGASIRATFLPGWGQIYTDSKIKGGMIFISTGALLTSGFIFRSDYQKVYQDYLDAYEDFGESSNQTKKLYDEANQRYKLMKFFFFASVGVWAYGIIDSYVNANIYNAQAKSGELLDDVKRIEELEFQFKVDRGRVGISLVKAF